MLIPFESAIQFTLGSLIVWYLAGVLCASIGALAAVFLCEKITWIKTTVGGLLGVVFYYCFSWLFQSRVSMEFARVFSTIID